MNLFRVGWPGLVAAALLFIGLQVALTASRYSRPADAMAELRTAIIPTAIGTALLLVTLALARRTRLGYVLGLAFAVLFAVAGVVFIVAQIPYLAQGGMSAAFAGPFMVLSGIWSLLWVVYAWRLHADEGPFAPAWARVDRSLGLVLLVLLVASGGAFVAIGATQDAVIDEGNADQAAAEALVRATTLAVRVVDILTSDDSGPESTVVERLRLELTISSPESYPLQGAPTLCLIDEATFADPAYKPGVLCWGTVGAPLSLEGFDDPTIGAGSMTLTGQLHRGASICAYGVGTWIAELAIAPRFDDASGGGLVDQPMPIVIVADFRVDDAAPGATGNDAETPPPACTGLEP